MRKWLAGLRLKQLTTMVFSWLTRNYLLLLPAMGAVELPVGFHIVTVNHRQKGIKANRQLQIFTLSDVSRLILLSSVNWLLSPVQGLFRY